MYPYTTAQPAEGKRAQQPKLWLSPSITAVLIQRDSLVAAAEMSLQPPVYSTMVPAAIGNQVTACGACKFGSLPNCHIPPPRWGAGRLR